MLEHRDVEQVSQAGLKMAVEIGVLQHALEVLADNVEMALENDRSCVSVPVLSVHSTSMAPKFWMALRRLTMTFLRDIAMAPLARLTVTIIGSISGVSPTATEIAKRKASSQSPLTRPLMKKTDRRHHRHEGIISHVNFLTLASKAVGSSSPTILSAIWPKTVLAPVATTTASP